MNKDKTIEKLKGKIEDLKYEIKFLKDEMKNSESVIKDLDTRLLREENSNCELKDMLTCIRDLLK